ncbi:hypothetical protein J6590_019223 [Homalodisca vitripennis]|nr:hypothetical protein J6590_019223 [Homalodisca vitripennis]
MESSLTSVDLESVRPPSCMGSLLSLTASVSEADKRRHTQRSLLARRALHTTTDNSLSWHNLDSIRPPEGMDEYERNLILSPVYRRQTVSDQINHTRQFRRQSGIDWTTAGNCQFFDQLFT